MSNLTDLSAAGARAAAQPVLPGPAAGELVATAKRRRARQAVAGGAFAFSVVALLAAPFVAGRLAADDPQSVVATGPAADPDPAADPGPAPALDENDPTPEDVPDDEAETRSNEGEEPSSEQGGLSLELDPDDPWEFHVDKRHFMMAIDGEFSLSVEVYVGAEASEQAARAAADATETVEHNGETVWVKDLGDERSVSVLVDEDTFVTVTGPADQLDDLLDMVTNGSPLLHHDLPGLDGFPVPSEEWREQLEERLKDLPDSDGVLPLPPEFSERLEKWSEEGDFSYEDHWNGEFPGDFFEGCLEIDTDGDGEPDISVKSGSDCDAES